MCYDGDAPEFHAEAWVRARKAHKCYSCRDGIRVGDKHHVITQKQEGEIDRFRHCARCYAIIEALLAAGSDGVQYDLNCGESWEDNFGPLPDHVAALAFVTPDEAQKTLVPR